MAGNPGDEGSAQPALTVARVTQMRKELAAAFSKLKTKHAEASQRRGDPESRAAANLLIQNFALLQERIVTEYNKCDVLSENVEYAANGLMGDLQAYVDALDNQYPMLSLTDEAEPASPIPVDPTGLVTEDRAVADFLPPITVIPISANVSAPLADATVNAGLNKTHREGRVGSVHSESGASSLLGLYVFQTSGRIEPHAK